MAKAIVIKDNHEPLVDIKKYCPGIFIKINPERLKKEKVFYLRRGVAKMLHQAQKNLPRGLNFIIGDAWRPDYIQARVYFGFIERFARKNPSWNKARVIKEVEKYVADWKGIKASGHMSGAAIDLRLADKRGRKIPMKSKKLTYQENALSAQPKLPLYMQKNRAIMDTALLKAGFSNFPKEYWHWSYGDYQWAQRNHKLVAIYGAVKDPRNIYGSELCPCGSNKKYKECHGK